ncbi:MAG: polymer-forming cytoskeletal protein [Comamonas sp.]
MAVQNPFFGKRDNDTFSSRNSATGMPSAGTLNSSGLGVPSSTNMRPATPPAAPVTEATGGSQLTVGPNIKLKGVEITDCDTLVVEGTVEATMNSRVIKIAANGAFHGTAEIDIAEIHGRFDGSLTVREKLVIYGSGKVSGKIRYGKVVIEEGGELTGQIEAGTGFSAAVSSTSAASSRSKSISMANTSPLSAVASTVEATGIAAVA